MNLAHIYSKEIISSLDLIPIYLPGVEVKIGDVISYDKKFLGGMSPIGSFQKQMNLANLEGINLTSTKDSSPDTYIYSSKGSVGINFNTTVNGIVGGELKVSFKKEGSIYFKAENCKKETLESLADLSRKLLPFKDAYPWSDFFIVTSVTVASKALIMQSNSKTAELILEANSPISGTPVLSSINIDMNIKSYKDASFIKEWSENVPVFMELVRFNKKKGVLKSEMGMKASPKPFELTEILPSKIIFE